MPGPALAGEFRLPTGSGRLIEFRPRLPVRDPSTTMRHRRPISALVLLALAAPTVCAQVGSPSARISELAGVRLLSLAGEELSFAAVAGDGPLVVAYTGVGCPIAQKYAPRLARLSERYAAHGVDFVLVDACPQDTRAGIAQELAELGLALPCFKDFRQELTSALDARTTTEVFVFGRDGALAYRGAIDDQYSLGAARPEPRENHLVDAIEALLAGRAPETALTAAPGCKITLASELELPEAVTWSKHIAPLVQQNCEECHRTGQVAPFSLQSYEKAKGWAEMMVEVVDEDRMPPWNADPAFDGVFANERRLSADEKALLHRWVEDGMPRGNPAEDPAPLEWSSNWKIGEPDVVFSMERWWRSSGTPGPELPETGFEVPREGVVDYQYFMVQTDYPEDRWVQAIEARAGAADVVHHVLVMVDDPKVSTGELDFTSYFAAAVPGDNSVIYPDGYGKRLPAGATLVFQMHYTPNGKERSDRSSVGLVFCEHPPALEVVTDAIVNDGFLIPAGADDHEVRAERVFVEDTAVLGYFPHMHTRGKDFKYTLYHADGTSEELLYTHYDFNWQEGYVYYDPFVIPAGSRLECVGHFDNSAKNPNNPDPKKDVSWGDQTFEEMFIGYFDCVRTIE